MSGYHDFLDHAKYGRVWYTVTLRNHYRMGCGAMANLLLGPCYEVKVHKHPYAFGTDSPEDAHKSLLKLLDSIQARGEDTLRPERRLSLINRWHIFRNAVMFRHWRAQRQWRKDGTVRVELPR